MSPAYVSMEWRSSLDPLCEDPRDPHKSCPFIVYYAAINHFKYLYLKLNMNSIWRKTGRTMYDKRRTVWGSSQRGFGEDFYSFLCHRAPLCLSFIFPLRPCLLLYLLFSLTSSNSPLSLVFSLTGSNSRSLSLSLSLSLSIYIYIYLYTSPLCKGIPIFFLNGNQVWGSHQIKL